MIIHGEEDEQRHEYVFVDGDDEGSWDENDAAVSPDQKNARKQRKFRTGPSPKDSDLLAVHPHSV